MNPTPRLSVIIPTYNRPKLTERAARSVLEQPDPIGIELLVADDGSTDNTVEHLARAFPEPLRSGRMRLLNFEHSGDGGISRNRAVTKARGLYVAFLDSDDWWSSKRLTHLAPLLEQYDLLLEPQIPVPSGMDPLAASLHMNYWQTSSAVLRRAFFDEMGGFLAGNATMGFKWRSGFEDYDLWLRCLATLWRRNQRDRVKILDTHDVVVEPQAVGLGRVKLRQQMYREIVTLVRVARAVPPAYQPKLWRHVAGSVKGIFAPSRSN